MSTTDAFLHVNRVYLQKLVNDANMVKTMNKLLEKIENKARAGDSTIKIDRDDIDCCHEGIFLELQKRDLIVWKVSKIGCSEWYQLNVSW